MDTVSAVLLTLAFILATLPIFHYQNHLNLKKRCKELEESLEEEHQKTIRLEKELEKAKGLVGKEAGVGDSSTTSGDQEISEVQEGVLKTLNENQKRIIQLLLDSKEYKLKQIDLFHETGIVKSTLSYELKNLQQRNIVEIKNVGRTNLIELTDWLKG
ncbi:hypothetical protein ACFLRC_02085 [Candidatus Altiarchaeota archaeon]